MRIFVVFGIQVFLLFADPYDEGYQKVMGRSRNREAQEQSMVVTEQEQGRNRARSKTKEGGDRGRVGAG